MRLSLKLAVVLAAAALTGCSTSHVSPMMQPANLLKPVAPSADNAVVIFMRPSNYGYLIQSSVFDLDDSGDTFVGIVSAGSKVAYAARPGEHTFMVIGENADFMKATLAPNKTYYALVEARMGWWKARFSLTPVHAAKLSHDEFGDWDRDTKLIENTNTSRQWAKDNAPSIHAKRDDYIQRWRGKSPAEIDEGGLRLEDGR